MLLLAARQEVTKKRAKTFPLGSPFPCRSARQKTRFDSVPTGRASSLANTRGRQRKQELFLFVLLKLWVITGCVADSKNFCNRMVRATSVFAFLLQNANAKSEFVYFRANMSVAIAKRRLRVAGFQRVLDPLARFLGSFFAAWQRMNIYAGTPSARSCARP
jgi:hypothetical protein